MKPNAIATLCQKSGPSDAKITLPSHSELFTRDYDVAVRTENTDNCVVTFTWLIFYVAEAITY